MGPGAKFYLKAAQAILWYVHLCHEHNVPITTGTAEAPGHRRPSGKRRGHLPLGGFLSRLLRGAVLEPTRAFPANPQQAACVSFYNETSVSFFQVGGGRRERIEYFWTHSTGRYESRHPVGRRAAVSPAVTPEEGLTTGRGPGHPLSSWHLASSTYRPRSQGEASHY